MVNPEISWEGGGAATPSQLIPPVSNFGFWIERTVRQLKTGAGWRLGWDAAAIEFSGLVGAEDWAIELTAAEFDDFCRLVVQLAETMAQMAQELMDQERICCEVESDRIWLEAEGLPQAYELRLMLLTGRRAEGNWGVRSVPGLVQAVQTLNVF